MKLLHTADFHAGKVLSGRNRNSEIEDSLKDILNIAEAEQVEAVLVAGDLFDGVAPGADALKIVFAFFGGLHRLGISSVVIAGNHDSKRRLDAYAPILSLAGVHVITKRPFGVLKLQLPSGSLAVAGVPFVDEKDALSGKGVASVSAEQQRELYRSNMQACLLGAKQQLREAAADHNVLMMHLSMEDATAAEDEKGYKFDRDHDFVLTTAQVREVNAHYVALGHIHRPQHITDENIRYPGSIVQLDFGERGQQKSVCIVELSKNNDRTTRTTVRTVDLPSLKQLRQIDVRAPKIPEDLEEAQQMYPEAFGDDVSCVKIIVSYQAGEGNPFNKQKAARCFPKMVRYDGRPLAGKDAQAPEEFAAPRLDLSNSKLFGQFCLKRNGQAPSAALMAAFREAEREAEAIIQASKEGTKA